jgi:hypothetical protein
VAMSASIVERSTHPGEVLLQQGLASDALPYLLTSSQTEPSEWRHFLNLAVACRQLGRYDEAKQHLTAAVNLAPKAWPIYHTWANVLDDIGEFKSSLDVRWKAWELCKRARREVALGLAVGLLRRGEWQTGWPYWELGRFLYSWSPPPGVNAWQGEPLEGKRLLVLAEGGYGDTFDQARWIPQLKGVITLCVHPRQTDLLRYSPELKGVTLLTLGEDIKTQEYDYATSILSLPSLLEATPETVPSPITFDLLPVFVRPSDTCRIGFCWQAEENGTPHKVRSIPGQLIQSFESVKADWYSLVPGQAFPWMKPSPTNWLDTARLIMTLDLVVTVDTAVAHLAGCLGKQVIVMLPVNNEWRWLAGSSDTVWYPNTTLVRSTKPDDWTEVVEEVKRIL